jgi:hypothetical protein
LDANSENPEGLVPLNAYETYLLIWARGNLRNYSADVLARYQAQIQAKDAEITTAQSDLAVFNQRMGSRLSTDAWTVGDERALLAGNLAKADTALGRARADLKFYKAAAEKELQDLQSSVANGTITPQERRTMEANSPTQRAYRNAQAALTSAQTEVQRLTAARSAFEGRTDNDLLWGKRRECVGDKDPDELRL